MRQINAFSLVVGQHACQAQPVRHGLSWRYPWEDMGPGAVIAVHIFITNPASAHSQRALAAMV